MTMQSGLPNDVSVPNLKLPGVGDWNRNAQPELGFNAWINGQYIPPQLKLMLRTLYGRMFEDYLTQSTQIMDTPPTVDRNTTQTPFGQENIFGTGVQQGQAGGLNDIPSWTSWLQQKSPFSLIRQNMGSMPGAMLQRMQGFGGVRRSRPF